MKLFAAGLTLGLLFGVAAVTIAAKMSGEDGYMKGWEVVVNGKKACADPYVRVSTKEIECI